jgi:FlaA1/EpsC-like NDP-sugar epimerase
MGVYRGVWQYFSMEDIVQYFKAVILSVVISAAAILFFDLGKSFTGLFFFYFGLFLFMGLVGSRSSIRLLRSFLYTQNQENFTKVIIIGAGDPGEITLRFLQQNPDLNLKVVGFYDHDPKLRGRQIHNFQIYGEIKQLKRFLQKSKVEGIIFSPHFTCDPRIKLELEELCKLNGYWMKQLVIGIEEINFDH